jgi:hypothetical protein
MGCRISVFMSKSALKFISNIPIVLRSSPCLYKLNIFQQTPAYINRSINTKMAAYPQRTIGNDKVSAQGLGCMGMSMAYTSLGGYDDVESLATLTEAADLGITFVYIASAHQFEKQLLNLRLVGYQ